ncbi:MAG: AAA family ATPase [Magnetococcus sp. YQC-5]
MSEAVRITRLTLKNFKSVDEQVYDFQQFDLLIGCNNSGKSTALQALAIWQFCVDQFHHSSRSGSKGIQVVLPNFTALPVPEFNLLWKDRTDRAYPMGEDGKRRQEFILIHIDVSWRNGAGTPGRFGVELRYHSPQTIYAIPSGGWETFRQADSSGMPQIAYIPPFSGLEPTEKRLDISPIRQQVGKGQPGSVLRNLLLSVVTPSSGVAASSRSAKRSHSSPEWQELAAKIKQWFSVDLRPPEYDPLQDVFIRVEYKQNNRDYDIISGGSGFHQTLTLLAFLYGYRPTTLLIDEPDAHLHASLQRAVLDFFRRKSTETGMQFLIATHAEEFVRGVAPGQIISLLTRCPERIESTPAVVRALAEIPNEEIDQVMQASCILYVEGQSDERILRALASACDAEGVMSKICFKTMNGGTKQAMKEHATRHYEALQQIVPHVSRLMLFDYDNDETAFHPKADNAVLVEWKRKNIENYLLVPDAWKRAARDDTGPLFAAALAPMIDSFFAEQNLNLPPNHTWRNVKANIFSVVDGKRILFENDDSLFHQLQNLDPSIMLVREKIALSMQVDEIHEDVHQFFNRLRVLIGMA